MPPSLRFTAILSQFYRKTPTNRFPFSRPLISKTLKSFSVSRLFVDLLPFESLAFESFLVHSSLALLRFGTFRMTWKRVLVSLQYAPEFLDTSAFVYLPSGICPSQIIWCLCTLKIICWPFKQFDTARTWGSRSTATYKVRTNKFRGALKRIRAILLTAKVEPPCALNTNVEYEVCIMNFALKVLRILFETTICLEISILKSLWSNFKV